MCLGIPGRVLEPVNPTEQTVLVDVQGTEKRISAAMLLDDGLPSIGVGEWVVVHLGFALSRMEENEARTVLDGLDELHDLYRDLPV